MKSELRWSKDILPWLAEARAMALRRTITGCDPLLSVLSRLPGRDAREAYQAVWDNRALVTRIQAQRRAQVSASPRAQSLYAQIRLTGQQLAQVTLAATKPNQQQARHKRLAELNEQKERLEAELARVSSEYRWSQQIAEASPVDLVRLVPKNAAIIEFYRATAWNPPPTGRGTLVPESHYDAFVLRPGETPAGIEVAWAQLGPTKPIDEAVRQWRQSLASGEGRGVDLDRAQPVPTAVAPDATLRKLVWDKVEPHLAGCTTVIVIPDADLCFLPWAALPGRKPGTFLLEDYAIGTDADAHRLYASLSENQRAAGSVLLVGGAQFDAAPVKPPDPKTPVAKQDATAAPRTRAPTMTDRRTWDYLPGTADEVQALERLWSGLPRPTVLRDVAASETALRSLMPKSRFIHLATHGFFADEKFRSMFGHDVAGEQLFGAGMELVTARRGGVTVRNPLILSGVVLAGANLPPKTDELGLPTGEDGILTAEEVVNLDLRNTELVVLSACDTGLGKVAGGEGVFGLQRAFALAGARTTIASLWKVDDAATQALMTEFYRNIWEKKLGKLESLRRAQLAMIAMYDPESGALRGAGAKTRVVPKTLRKPGQAEPAKSPLPPFYWAAFTLGGDWR
jgi:CHAT domain-containing protein